MNATAHRLAALSAVAALAGAGLAWWPRADVPAEPFDPSSDALCIVAPATPYDPATGLGPDTPRPVPASARCPVCGMAPARFPDWAAQAIFDDGATHFFDSPVNLLTFLRDVSRYSPYRPEQVVASFVNDIASGQWTPAATAFYVQGSSALGPMREGNLPAFAERAIAERFAAERGGRVLSLAEIDDSILADLAARKHDH